MYFMDSSKIHFELGCNNYRASPLKYICCDSISHTSEDGSFCIVWNPCGQAFPCRDIQVYTFLLGVDQLWLNWRRYFIHDWTIYFFELLFNVWDIFGFILISYVITDVNYDLINDLINELINDLINVMIYDLINNDFISLMIWLMIWFMFWLMVWRII